MFNEFKEFIMRGNVLDLAVGIIIGAAFGAIVNSAVNDLIMPPIGMATGQVDFKDLFISLNNQHYPSLKAAKDAGAPVIAYGLFLNNIINFLIISLVIFFIVKQVNRLRAPALVATKECLYCGNAIPLKATRCGFCTSDLTR